MNTYTGPSQCADARTFRSIAIFVCVLSFGAAVSAADPVPNAGPRTGEDDRANQVAHEIFEGQDYWWKRTSDVKSSSSIREFFMTIYTYLIEPVLKGLWDAFVWILKTLFNPLAPLAGDWSNGVPFTWVLVGLLGLFAVWQLVRIFRGSRHTVVPITASDKLDVLPRAEQLLEEARAALSAGDHRMAIRFAFLSLLAWYQDRGQLKYDPSRSNREYERDLRTWPESVTIFRAASAPFDRCWYGGRDLDRAQIENVIAICARAMQSTEQRGGK